MFRDINNSYIFMTENKISTNCKKEKQNIQMKHDYELKILTLQKQACVCSTIELHFVTDEIENVIR